MSKNDVSASIAGYYRQVFEATKEVLYLKNDNDSVGIECGADVRIFKEDGSKQSIEVKLKKDVGMYSKDLFQTMYNFKEFAPNDIKLQFKANTKPFEIDNKEKYILHLFLKYYMGIRYKDKMNSIKEWHKQNSEKCEYRGCTADKICVKCLDGLVEYIMNNSNKLNMYIPSFDSMEEFKFFVKKVDLQFEGVDKLTSFENIQKNILSQIDKLVQRYCNKRLDIKMLENIMHRIIIKFLDSSVLNSLEKGEKDPAYKDVKKVKFVEIIGVIKNHEKQWDEVEENILNQYFKVFDSLHEEKLDVNLILESFHQDFRRFQEFNVNVEEVSEFNIIKYLDESNTRFFSRTEKNKLIKRFMKYSQGFGIIAYIMDEDITVIDISKRNLFVENYLEEKISIENNRLYKFDDIYNILENDHKSNNGILKATVINNFYCLIKQDFIQITKCKNNISYIDYISINEIEENIITEISSLLINKKSILALKRGPKDARNLFNLFIELIPKNFSLGFISEDLRNVPSNINENVFIIDTLKLDDEKKFYDNILTLIKTLSLDMFILDIEFVNCISEERKEFLTNLEQIKDVGIILLENFAVSKLYGVVNFNQIKERKIYGIPDIFEGVLVFDDWKVKDRTKDELKFFKKIK